VGPIIGLGARSVTSGRAECSEQVVSRVEKFSNAGTIHDVGRERERKLPVQFF
jgi:hypothetical protein